MVDVCVNTRNRLALSTTQEMKDGKDQKGTLPGPILTAGVHKWEHKKRRELIERAEEENEKDALLAQIMDQEAQARDVEEKVKLKEARAH